MLLRAARRAGEAASGAPGAPAAPPAPHPGAARRDRNGRPRPGPPPLKTIPNRCPTRSRARVSIRGHARPSPRRPRLVSLPGPLAVHPRLTSRRLPASLLGFSSRPACRIPFQQGRRLALAHPVPFRAGPVSFRAGPLSFQAGPVWLRADPPVQAPVPSTFGRRGISSRLPLLPLGSSMSRRDWRGSRPAPPSLVTSCPDCLSALPPPPGWPV